jgi:hypothetical protein
VARLGEERKVYKVLERKPGESPLERLRHRLKYRIRQDLKEDLLGV